MDASLRGITSDWCIQPLDDLHDELVPPIENPILIVDLTCRPNARLMLSERLLYDLRWGMSQFLQASPT